MRPVPKEDQDLAQAAMFSRHPAMEQWPAGHRWQLWELHVDEVHLLDWYGEYAGGCLMPLSASNVARYSACSGQLSKMATASPSHV